MRSTLTEQVDLEGVVFEVDQRILHGWLPVFGASFVLCVVGTACWQGCGWFGVVSWMLGFASLLGGRRRARITLGPRRVVVTGWLGRLPRPGTRTMPLADTRAEQGWVALGRDQPITLALVGSDETVILTGLVAARPDVARIDRRLDELRAFARSLAGEDALSPDLPDALRELRERVSVE